LNEQETILLLPMMTFNRMIQAEVLYCSVLSVPPSIKVIRLGKGLVYNIHG